jgi:predicted amidohydrolase YtcJ
MCDLILLNANVITMDPAQPCAELVFIAGNRVSLVARNDALARLRKREALIIDCAGKTLLPGFIDAHCHVHAYAESLVSLNLSSRGQVKSIPDIQNRIRTFCKSRPPGSWIRGKGYNEFYLAEKRHPTRWDLDAAAPQHPVKLTHRSGHAHILNSLALRQVQIGIETGDIPGGLINRDPHTGEPDGILYGMGEYLAGRVPALSDAEMDQGLALANAKLLSYGITSVQDASSSNDLHRWNQFADWKARGLFQPRTTMMVGLSAFLKSSQSPFASLMDTAELRLGSVKIIAGEVTGNLHPSQEELNETVSAIHAAGRQVAIHAIEEPVIEAACKAIEQALKQNPRPDHRHRIEHCSVCPPPLLRRLAKLGIAIVTQPSFVYYEGDRYMKTVPGDQIEHLYAIGSMLKSNLLVASGSDFPIADPNPLVGICTAATRKTECGLALSEDSASVADAIKLCTSSAAAVAFQEGIKGSVSPGKFADLVVLNENPFEIDADQIKDIRVMMTILGGRVVWSDGSLYPITPLLSKE